jgi:molybdopterin converting factor small subunit
METDVKVRFFGSLSEAIGREVEVPAPQRCTVGGLRAALARLYPDAKGVAEVDRVRAVVADRIVKDDFVLAEADAVEFLPPLSGG